MNDLFLYLFLQFCAFLVKKKLKSFGQHNARNKRVGLYLFQGFYAIAPMMYLVRWATSFKSKFM